MTFDSGSVKRPQAGCDRFYRFAATGSMNCPQILATRTRTTRVESAPTHTFGRWSNPEARSGPGAVTCKEVCATATSAGMTDPYFSHQCDIRPQLARLAHITLP